MARLYVAVQHDLAKGTPKPSLGIPASSGRQTARRGFPPLNTPTEGRAALYGTLPNRAPVGCRQSLAALDWQSGVATPNAPASGHGRAMPRPPPRRPPNVTICNNLSLAGFTGHRLPFLACHPPIRNCRISTRKRCCEIGETGKPSGSPTPLPASLFLGQPAVVKPAARPSTLPTASPLHG